MNGIDHSKIPCRCGHPAAVHSAHGCNFLFRSGMCHCGASFGKTSVDDYDLDLVHETEENKAMPSDQLFTQTDLTMNQQVSTPYGEGCVIEFMDRYASLGAQQTTKHVKVKTPSGTVHWFEIVKVDENYNRI